MMTGKLKILAIGLVMIGANLLLSGHAGAYMIGKTVY